MTTPEKESRNWMDMTGDWVWSKWRWLVGGVVLLFALNNIAGLVVGALGAIAFLNGILGRVLKARRAVEQIQKIVANPDDR